MTLYTCECGKESKEIGKATIVNRDGKWVCKEAECSCGKYMNSEPTEGIPTLRRTEPSLSTIDLLRLSPYIGNQLKEILPNPFNLGNDGEDEEKNE